MSNVIIECDFTNRPPSLLKVEQFPGSCFRWETAPDEPLLVRVDGSINIEGIFAITGNLQISTPPGRTIPLSVDGSTLDVAGFDECVFVSNGGAPLGFVGNLTLTSPGEDFLSIEFPNGLDIGGNTPLPFLLQSPFGVRSDPTSMEPVDVFVDSDVPIDVVGTATATFDPSQPLQLTTNSNTISSIADGQLCIDSLDPNGLPVNMNASLSPGGVIDGNLSGGIDVSGTLPLSIYTNDGAPLFLKTGTTRLAATDIIVTVPIDLEIENNAFDVSPTGCVQLSTTLCGEDLKTNIVVDDGCLNVKGNVNELPVSVEGCVTLENCDTEPLSLILTNDSTVPPNCTVSAVGADSSTSPFNTTLTILQATTKAIVVTPPVSAPESSYCVTKLTFDVDNSQTDFTIRIVAVSNGFQAVDLSFSVNDFAKIATGLGETLNVGDTRVTYRLDLDKITDNAVVLIQPDVDLLEVSVSGSMNADLPVFVAGICTCPACPPIDAIFPPTLGFGFIGDNLSSFDLQTGNEVSVLAPNFLSTVGFDNNALALNFVTGDIFGIGEYPFGFTGAEPLPYLYRIFKDDPSQSVRKLTTLTNGGLALPLNDMAGLAGVLSATFVRNTNNFHVLFANSVAGYSLLPFIDIVSGNSSVGLKNIAVSGSVHASLASTVGGQLLLAYGTATDLVVDVINPSTGTVASNLVTFAAANSDVFFASYNNANPLEIFIYFTTTDSPNARFVTVNSITGSVTSLTSPPLTYERGFIAANVSTVGKVGNVSNTGQFRTLLGV